MGASWGVRHYLGAAVDEIEAFIDRMEELVTRWRALEEPLTDIRREMQQEREEVGQ